MDCKSLIAGSLATLIIGLINLAVFTLSSAYTGTYAANIDFFIAYRSQIYFVFAFVPFCCTMGLGGYVTALMAGQREVLHGAITGTLVGGLSLFSSTSVGDFSLTSVVLIVFSGICGGVGGGVRELVKKRTTKRQLRAEATDC